MKLRLPIRVDIATGEILEPTGVDPYTLPWVEGAASTVPGVIRRLYAIESADWPSYGPRRRPAEYRVLDQSPLPADGQPIWE